MRTTLKRGIGQSVDGNGDGHGALLPDALSSMRRYRQPPKRRTALGLTGRIVLIIVAIVVMFGAALAGGAWLFFDKSVDAVKPHTAGVIAAKQVLQAPLPGRPTNALILGYDKRFNEGGFGRSDTLILVRADPISKSISMLSFPRDLLVPIYCPGRAVWTDKINAAYANCNVRGAVSTIHHLTGLGINYVITVNFRGFRQVVDRLGGVWIDVDHRYFNRNVHTAETNYASINLRPGYQRLKGQQALDYVRFRHTDSDFHRNARQQAFVKAIKEQVSTSLSLTDIPGLLSAAARNIEIARGGGHDISNSEVLRYAFLAYELPPGHFFQPKIGGIQGYASLTTSQANIDAAVRDFKHPDIESPEAAEQSILGRRRGERPKVKPGQVSVSVLNGNRVQGSAADARAQLKERGFRTVEPVNPLAANAPNQTYWHSTVYYDPSKKRGKAGARLIADAFGDAGVVRGIPAALKPLAQHAMTVAVVGRTFHNLTPAQETKIPKKQPPVIRKDPAETRAMLRKAQRKVPFRLEVPWILERNSQADRVMPLRVYSLEDHKAVRLVFQMQDGWDYWGIEETDWDDAPALEKPNSTRFIKNRRFDLYFSGSHIHQIVLRDNDATYWVVNSLMNDLSNETMLAIAKGLRPLKKHR